MIYSVVDVINDYQVFSFDSFDESAKRYITNVFNKHGFAIQDVMVSGNESRERKKINATYTVNQSNNKDVSSMRHVHTDRNQRRSTLLNTGR